jgi:NAD(P)-dependent dehydrogenase (short-subunit alcohol dehydrogenase family)
MNMQDWSLDGKVAIVTGAAVGGIGETFALMLADAGASVVCADINFEGAQGVADRVTESGGRALAIHVDVTDEKSIDQAVAATIAEFGGVDILVNNAALMIALVGTSLIDYTRERWDEAMAVNVTGAWMFAKAVVPSMTARGGGRIVGMSSLGAYPAGSVYGITKLAMVGLTTSLAGELGPLNITVNAIAPGFTQSEAGMKLTPQSGPMREAIEARAATRATGTPHELANVLHLLVSQAGDWISGQVIHVDGGSIRRP